jgi:addiction module HigA family antidote
MNRKLRPIHPGEVLREDVIPASGLNKSEFAKRIGLTREALHNILTGKSAVSTVVALKLERLLGTSAQMWLNLQQAYELAVTAEAKRDEIERVEALEFA